MDKEKIKVIVKRCSFYETTPEELGVVRKHDEPWNDFVYRIKATVHSYDKLSNGDYFQSFYPNKVNISTEVIKEE